MVNQNKPKHPVHNGRYAQTISRSSNLHQMQQQQQYQQIQQQQQLAMRNPIGYIDFHQRYSATMSPTQDSRGLTMGAVPRSRHESLMGIIETQALLNKPLCRCRVMYLGSAVPHYTKNGLHGIQEPLKHLYPEEQFSAGNLAGVQTTNISTTIDISHLSSGLGIDSWLSVWSNGLLLQNVDEFGQEIKRFFSIESLHYCAAVRFFDTTSLMSLETKRSVVDEQTGNKQTLDSNNNNSNQLASTDQTSSQDRQHEQQIMRQRKSVVRFLPLDAPLFQCPGMMDPNHPPVFAAIMRRTTGIKVLECHAFICRRDAAANALVRCCTHAYADFLSAKRLSVDFGFTGSARNEYRGPATSGRSGPKQRSKLHLNDEQRMSSFGSKSMRMDSLNNNNNNGSRDSTVATTSNEENSLEVSSEDNYAIITKHPQPTCSKSIGIESCDSSSGKQVIQDNYEVLFDKREDRKKGSSKSLYDDFRPRNVIGQPDLDPPEGEKLSHSLDILDVCNEADFDDTSQYSTSNKRHSRSMQNLDGPFEFSASEANSSARRNQRRHSRRSKEEISSGTFNEKSRKAASCLDVRKANYDKQSLDQYRNQCCQPANGHPPSGRDPQEYSVCKQLESNQGKIFVKNEPERVGKRSHRRAQANKGQQHHQQQQQPVLPPVPVCRLGNECNLIQQQQPLHYYEQTQHLHHHHHPSQLLPNSHYYHPLIYGPAPVPNSMYHYGPACYPIPAPHYATNLGQYGPGSASGNLYASIPDNVQHIANSYLTPIAANPAATTTPSARRHPKGSSLTTRCRCLSPPINILTGGKSNRDDPRQQRRRASREETEVEVEAARRMSEEVVAMNGPEVAINQQVARSQTSELAQSDRPASVCGEFEQVVSAQPSFMCSSSASANTLRAKKMSWIKRLSLTMGGGNPIGQRQEASLTEREPRGSQERSQTDQEKAPRRRSGLFSGTLTLGRRQQQRDQKQSRLPD